MSSEAVFFEPNAVDKSHFCLRFLLAMAASLKAQPPVRPAVQPAQGVSAPRRRRGSRKRRRKSFPSRAGAVHGFGIAGDKFDGLHVDCRGAYFCHRPRDDLEKHQGNPVGDAERDGSARRRLGRFDGRHFDQRVTRWVFPFATTFFIFIVMSNFVDLIPGVGSIGVGTPANSSLPFAIDHVAGRFSARRQRMRI